MRCTLLIARTPGHRLSHRAEDRAVVWKGLVRRVCLGGKEKRRKRAFWGDPPPIQLDCTTASGNIIGLTPDKSVIGGGGGGVELRVSPNQIDLDGATTPTVSTPFFPKLHHPQNKHNKLHYLTPSMAVTINTAADLQLYVKTGLFYS